MHRSILWCKRCGRCAKDRPTSSWCPVGKAEGGRCVYMTPCPAGNHCGGLDIGRIIFARYFLDSPIMRPYLAVLLASHNKISCSVIQYAPVAILYFRIFIVIVTDQLAIQGLGPRPTLGRSSPPILLERSLTLPLVHSWLPIISFVAHLVD